MTERAGLWAVCVVEIRVRVMVDPAWLGGKNLLQSIAKRPVREGAPFKRTCGAQSKNRVHFLSLVLALTLSPWTFERAPFGLWESYIQQGKKDTVVKGTGQHNSTGTKMTVRHTNYL